MMNVAATRAKKEFYLIGDKELYLGIGSDVAQETYKVIKKYKKEQPDKVVEYTEPEEKERNEENVESDGTERNKDNIISKGMERSKDNITLKSIEKNENNVIQKDMEGNKENVIPEVASSEPKSNMTEKNTQTESNEAVKETVMYIGNRQNQSFHCLDCKYAPKNPIKRVEFCSKKEATGMGYSACKTCNP